MVRHLLPLIALLGAPVAQSAYATLPMPVGMSAPAVGSPYSLYNVANATYKGGYYLTQAVLNLGARQVTVPMAFRVAGAASYLAAGALAPYVSAGLLAYEAYPYIRDWFSRGPAQTQAAEPADGKVVLPGGGIDAADVLFSDGRTLASIFPGATVESVGYSAVCHVNCLNGSGGPYVLYYRPGNSYTTFSCLVQVNSCSTPVPLPSPREAVVVSPSQIAALGDYPVDPRVLPLLGASVPVDPTPVINPPDFADSPALVGPAGNTAPVIGSRPFAVPNGEPIAVPNTSPVQYVQPWWEVTPAPTVQDPYRVQVVSTTTTIVIDRPVITAPPPIVPLTCDLFPNSLGCIPLSPIPDPEPVPQVDRAITLQAGPTLSGGSCPPDLVLSVHGTTITVPAMATACSWISMARPVILLLAALSAIAIVRPGGGKNAKPA